VAPGVFGVTRLLPNQTSCVVEFSAVAGAKDYRVYDPAHLHNGSPVYKYSGGGLRIEINGLDPALASQPQYILEAVDCLGPFQYTDATTPHTDMHSVNGQGPSTNAPHVLATSAPFVPLTAKQPWPTQPGAVSLFRDTFEDTSMEATMFAPAALPALTPAQSAMNLEFWNTWQTRLESKNWRVDFLGQERGTESVFIHQRHLMDILLDGEKRNNNASSVFQPLVGGQEVVFDLSDGKIVHLTYEVDAHFQPRRWCEVQFKPAGETFLNPGKFVDISVDRRPTESGNLIRWQAQNTFHHLDVFRGDSTNINKWFEEGQIDTSWGPTSERFDSTVNITRSEYYWPQPNLNGTMADLDLRHKFDMYLSAAEYALYENGILVKRHAWKSPLPFTRMSPAFVHQVYHTDNEMPWMEGGEYYYQYIENADERHWNNFGIEIVPRFP
jgi:hypothetical protein